MEKLKTAIIGCGKVAHIHAAALSKLNNSEFSAVCSRSFERAKSFARKYQVQAYQNVREMITKAKVEALAVCTPHPDHAEVAVAAMQEGAHVIVEKPLASSLEHCDVMIHTARQKQLKLAMISQRRLYPPVQRIKKAIEDGKLDVPIMGIVIMFGWRDHDYYLSDAWRGTWAGEGGGVLVNQAPHQIDILQWFMGPITELYGCWANLNHHDIEVDDTSLAIIRFENGALGNLIVSNSQNPALYGKVAIFGKNGASVGVQTDGGAMFIAGETSITEPPINDLWTIPGEAEMLRKWQLQDRQLFKSIDATEYYHKLQIEDFLSSILNDHEPMITGEEGRKTVEIFTAIYRSQRENQSIKFPI
jgi:predicted dehydrogenase